MHIVASFLLESHSLGSIFCQHTVVAFKHTCVPVKNADHLQDMVLRGFIKFLCRRSVGFFSWAFFVFLMKESKKRRQEQLGKLMAKPRSQPVNLPSVQPLMNPLGPCPKPSKSRTVWR